MRMRFLALLWLVAAPLHAAGSLLVWPVDPVIVADARAVALWLENRGDEPLLLQVRVFGWTQQQGENRHDPQNEVVGTPPMVEIAPGKRQLVRLTRIAAVPAGQELAYRVIVDEIPRAMAGGTPAGAGVQFQMRYSIPLFVYGEVLRPVRAQGKAGAPPLPLKWRIVEQDGIRYLEVHNQGAVHARLTAAELRRGNVRVGMADGLLGYVLAGAIMRWRLPDEAPQQATFLASVNGAEASALAPVPN